MCTWRVGVLTALCFLQPATETASGTGRAGGGSAGERAEKSSETTEEATTYSVKDGSHKCRVQLPPPQDVTLLSKDFDLILTWAPGEGSPPDVTYTVRYESQDLTDKWIKVPHCKNIRRTSCNLTCVLPNLFVKARARVKAVSGRLQSPWVESQFKEYHLDVELAPPVLNVDIKENSIHVNASFPLAACVESFSWTYDLNLWEAGSEDKKTYERKFRTETVTIDTTALRGNYCLSARSSYESVEFKHSPFSHPVCVLLNHKAVEWRFPFHATIPVLVLTVFLTSVFIVCWLKQDAEQKMKPHALDFSHLKAAGAAFHFEPSEKESYGDYLICTEQPVSQRKTNKTSARNNLPRVDSFLSSSSSEEEEEEDSGTFIPYTEMPQFPKRHLNCEPSRTAQEETGSDSGSGDLSVDSESVLDLSTLGFSFFPTRKNEVDTSGSQGMETASLSGSSSLGGISLTDVRFPGPREHGQQDTDTDEHLEMTPLQTPAEGTCAKAPTEGHYLHRNAHRFPKYYQKSILDPQVRIGEISQLREDPSTQQFVAFQTSQLAEDEGIASDCDSDNSTEGTPPAPTVLSDAFGTSTTKEKYDQKFQFKGYERAHYMGRS